LRWSKPGPSSGSTSPGSGQRRDVVVYMISPRTRWSRPCRLQTGQLN